MGDLKEEGLDLSNPEELKRQILEEMKVSYGVERKYANISTHNCIEVWAFIRVQFVVKLCSLQTKNEISLYTIFFFH